MTTAPALDVEDLDVYFQTAEGEVQVVSEVSFSVSPGELIGLVGESGSGKSATALAIMGLLPVGLSRTDGTATVGEVDLLGLSRRRLGEVRGRDVSMIFQEPMTALDPVFRVGDQIAETIRAHHRVSRRAALGRATEILADVGIPDPASRARAYPHQLSGGMRQRVMIAIAIASEPAVLIADEPTTALDVTVQAQILGLLDELSRERGTAVVLITHDLGVVAETCARVYTMYAGEIVEECTVDEVLLEPKHPYTSGLIQSIPRTEEQGRPLYSIPGRVPPPSAMPSGCRFRQRCAHAVDACKAPQPLHRVGGREVRCRRAGELSLPGAVGSPV